MKFTKIGLVSLFSLFSVTLAFGQGTPAPQGGGQPVEVSANTLQSGRYNGEEVRRLLGNVVMRQGQTTLTSDSAYQYVSDRNKLEVFSNVHITQPGMDATSTTASYDGTRRIATMRGNVTLRDEQMTLTTPSLDYDLNAKRAYYTTTGNIVGPDYTINSQLGTYTSDDKVLTFKKNIKYVGQNAEVLSDTMSYNTVTKVVEFFGPTTIKSPDGTLRANRGTYNTVTRESNFRGNASIKTPDYLIKGETLTYDKAKEYYTASRNVSMTAIKDTAIITGQTALYWRAQGRAKVFGSPVMRTIEKRDTMYLSADTLVSVENVKDKTKKGKLYAYHDVRIFKSDLQGLCDSLTYDQNDSVIYMNRNPRLWANKNQMTADSVVLQLRGNTLDQMRMYGNSFAISIDTLENYNQVKGRNMIARFADGKIRRIDVNGNGESLYFALQGDTATMGMNRAVCSDMRLMFEEGKVQTITFLEQPDAKLIPPHELEEPDTRLKGFVWRSDEKPTRAFVLAKRGAKKAAAKATGTQVPATTTKAAAKGNRASAEASVKPEPRSTGPQTQPSSPKPASPPPAKKRAVGFGSGFKKGS
ncbi:OstA-like protein [Rufibacter sp. XAAS-G3-1]|uniref:OstA-like protein n=1 Tax=Rufibacter sp. XAAS-G3-1 TaxID=2729134 RepID=UPI0015E69AE7|nr:OstA-like protein [Rufibacter sp. XAAS-G3-1]